MRETRGGKKSATDILNDKQICGCLNQSLGSTYIFFSLIVDECDVCVCVGVTFGWGRHFSYAMLAFGVFVYKACEMEEVRLCGGR